LYFQLAIQLYQESFDINPTDPTSLSNIAAIYLQIEDPEECLNICQYALEICEQNDSETKIIARI
jgi:tetratricopeptide (TPR) repeat protein